MQHIGIHRPVRQPLGNLRLILAERRRTPRGEGFGLAKRAFGIFEILEVIGIVGPVWVPQGHSNVLAVAHGGLELGKHRRRGGRDVIQILQAVGWNGFVFHGLCEASAGLNADDLVIEQIGVVRQLGNGIDWSV